MAFKEQRIAFKEHFVVYSYVGEYVKYDYMLARAMHVSSGLVYFTSKRCDVLIQREL